jgi:hypothetical protein
MRTSLHSLQLPFNELFHQFAANRLLRPRFAVFKSTGIFTRLSSDSPLGYSLEADLPNSVLHRIGILGLTVNRTLTYFIVTHAYICFSRRSSMARATPSPRRECSPTSAHRCAIHGFGAALDARSLSMPDRSTSELSLQSDLVSST